MNSSANQVTQYKDALKLMKKKYNSLEGQHSRIVVIALFILQNLKVNLTL